MSDVSEEEEEGDKRFSAPLSDREMQALTEKDVPENTKKAISWATGMFEDWRKNRNAAILKRGNLSSFLIRSTLMALTPSELNYAMSRFVSEIKKTDGSEFPPKTI